MYGLVGEDEDPADQETPRQRDRYGHSEDGKRDPDRHARMIAHARLRGYCGQIVHPSCYEPVRP